MLKTGPLPIVVPTVVPSIPTTVTPMHVFKLGYLYKQEIIGHPDTLLAPSDKPLECSLHGTLFNDPQLGMRFSRQIIHILP